MFMVTSPQIPPSATTEGRRRIGSNLITKPKYETNVIHSLFGWVRYTIQQVCTDYSSPSPFHSATTPKKKKRQEPIQEKTPRSSGRDDGLEAVEPVELGREPRPRLPPALGRRGPLVGRLLLPRRWRRVRRGPGPRGGRAPPREPGGRGGGEAGRGDVRRRRAQDGEGQDLVHGLVGHRRRPGGWKSAEVGVPFSCFVWNCWFLLWRALAPAVAVAFGVCARLPLAGWWLLLCPLGPSCLATGFLKDPCCPRGRRDEEGWGGARGRSGKVPARTRSEADSRMVARGRDAKPASDDCVRRP
jgi:hypothetical protein